MMMQQHWAIEIDRDDITRAELVDDPQEPLSIGQVRVHIDLYAMTANNVTYAALGKPAGLFGNEQGYWDFFAERDKPGRLPVWGFATVTESTADGIAPGESFYGYFPMASDAVLTAGHIRQSGFVDVTPRRSTLPFFYNHYQRVKALDDYRPAHHAYWPIFRPLLLTGWLIADLFEEANDYGVQQILIASASSKTAIGLAFSLAQRSGPRPVSVGLTSRAHVALLATQGIYDRVIAYDDISTLIPTMPSALVDIAGSGAVTLAVHSRFGENLKTSLMVGRSHWDAGTPHAALPGPKREVFFAPGRSQKRLADWGGATFGQRIAESWIAFMGVAPRLAHVDKRRGGDAALAAYREILLGPANPKSGIVVVP